MRVVIIGNGTAGIHAMLSIKKHAPKTDVTVITHDEPFFYSRPEITQLIEDPYTLQSIALPVPGTIVKEITLIQQAVEEIDPKRGILRLADESTLAYDRLIFATGAAPKSVKIIGIPKDSILTLRTARDALRIAAFLSEISSPVILGGGLIGLKIAHTLTRLGISPTVIVSSPQILSRTLDTETASQIQKLFEANGVTFHLGAALRYADWDERKRKGIIQTEAGKKIPFDLLIAGKGVTPRIDLAKKAGILIENGGIAVTDSMETSYKNHYAAGDCASIFNHETGHYENRAIWPVAAESGRIAGEAVTGKLISSGRFSAPIARNAISFFSIPMVSIGTIRGDGLKMSVFQDPSRSIVRKIFQENGRIVGTVLIGDIMHAGLLLEAVRKKSLIRQIPPWLLQGAPNLTQQIPSMEVLFS